MISQGVISSTNRYYDVTRGDYESVDFNINNDLFPDINKLNNKQARVLVDGFLAMDGVEISNYDSRIRSHISNAKPYENIKSYDEEMDGGAHKMKIKARALQYLLNKAPLKLTVDGAEFIHGDQNYGIGNSIRILTKTKAETEESRIDTRTSGDYLIAAATYTFKFSIISLISIVISFCIDSVLTLKGTVPSAVVQREVLSLALILFDTFRSTIIL